MFLATLGTAGNARAAGISAPADAVPSLGFPGAADQRFELLAGDIGLADDCLTQGPAVDTVFMLAKAEIDKKTVRDSATRKKERAETVSGAGATRTDAAPAAAGALSGSTEASAAPAAVGLAASATRDWEIIVSDKTLNATMARWAAAAGWQLLWELPVDYAVEARTRVTGTFEEAVSIVARSMERAEIPMKAVFYQGNKVLRIIAKGSE
ncbi:toxin co-regulated pilus biosynthesis Q family protein [Herbaspirillum sp. LeCh32-8]|uniref:toxin co-regulated pilus biosynthesis Q family protein n=1 Tax=Herbaspirillum sp. LeCh32-8 TaxID=2821356 RepID=UPI001FD7636B|nr:toxin co-regulated pilus biosynthesis Q family protein [Herbaspirillum sp. LeCh32-8]